MNKSLILAAALAYSASSFAQSDMEFSYNFSSAEPQWTGYGLRETIDVAVLVNEQALRGSKLKSITVPMPDVADAFTEASGWVSSELKLENKKNVPDLASVEATVKDGMLTAVFSEPFVIPDTPIYVGYSFTVGELTDKTRIPIAVVGGDNPQGLYLHASRSQLKWNTLVGRFDGGANSALVLNLEGDFPALNGMIGLSTDFLVENGKAQSVSVDYVNLGSTPVTSIDYSWSVAGQQGKGACDFSDNPVPVRYQGTRAFNLEVPAIASVGTYPFSFTLEKINGVALEEPVNSECDYIVSDFVPVKRPLVEEYTGLECGFCPGALVVVENMHKTFGDRFVAAAWHNTDPMSISGRYPSQVTEFPMLYIDRSDKGITSPSLVYDTWPVAASQQTSLDIAATLEYADVDKTQLNGRVTVRTARELLDVDYKIAVMLVEDGLSNPNWEQLNYFSPDDPEIAGEFGEIFRNGGQKVKGVVYNDVVVYAQDRLGIDDSFPTTLEAFGTVNRDFSVKLDDIVNAGDISLVQNKDKFRLIAMVLDVSRTGNGKVVNCVSSAYPGENTPGSVGEIEDEVITSTAYYDLQGRRLDATAEGLLIKIDTYADGKVKSAKVLK